MKTISTIILLFILEISYAQDTSATWLTNIDTTSFRTFYNKKSIPKEFYKLIGIDNIRDIVSANKPYRKGCVGRLPGHRLNWLAKDDKNHWILSVSFGGRFSGTEYIYIDRDKGDINVNGFYFTGDNRSDLTLGQTTLKLKQNDFHRVDSSRFEEEE